jgi:hypothetical protein
LALRCKRIVEIKYVIYSVKLPIQQLPEQSISRHDASR